MKRDKATDLIGLLQKAINIILMGLRARIGNFKRKAEKRKKHVSKRFSVNTKKGYQKM